MMRCIALNRAEAIKPPEIRAKRVAPRGKEMYRTPRPCGPRMGTGPRGDGIKRGLLMGNYAERR